MGSLKVDSLYAQESFGGGVKDVSNYRMREYDENQDEPRTQITSTSVGRKWSIASIVCSVFALIIPILFGPAGIVLGIIGRSKGAGKISTIAIVTSVVLMILGFVANALLMTILGGMTSSA